jgi:hypothetical protein
MDPPDIRSYIICGCKYIACIWAQNHKWTIILLSTKILLVQLKCENCNFCKPFLEHSAWAKFVNPQRMMEICWEFLRIQQDHRFAPLMKQGIDWKGVTNYNWSFMICSLINFCLKPWSYTRHTTCSLPAFSRIFIKFCANSSGSIVFKLFDTLCPRLLHWAAAHSSRTKNDRIRHASADHPARRFWLSASNSITLQTCL